MQLGSLDSSPLTLAGEGSEPCPPGRTRNLLVHLAQACAAQMDADVLTLLIADRLERGTTIRTVAWSAERDQAERLNHRLDAWMAESLPGNPVHKLVSMPRTAAVERIELTRSMRPLRSVAVSTRFDPVTGMHIRMVFGMQHCTALSAQQQEIIDRLCLAMRDALRMRQEHLEDTGRLAALYMASPALLLLLDAEGCVLATSALCSEHFGWVRKSVVGVALRTLLSERSRVEFDARRTYWWRQGGCRDWPCQVIAADQSMREVLLSMSIEFGPTGEAVSIKCAIVDVTELSKAS